MQPHQITGLLAQAVIGFIMSGAYVPLTKHVAAFAVVYGIFLSCGELGQLLCLQCHEAQENLIV